VRSILSNRNTLRESRVRASLSFMRPNSRIFSGHLALLFVVLIGIVSRL